MWGCRVGGMRWVGILLLRPFKNKECLDSGFFYNTSRLFLTPSPFNDCTLLQSGGVTRTHSMPFTALQLRKAY